MTLTAERIIQRWNEKKNPPEPKERKHTLHQRKNPPLLTPIRERILAFIASHLAEKKYPPTIREIQSNCGLASTSHVTMHLDALEVLNKIVRDRKVSRGIRLVEVSHEQV